MFQKEKNIIKKERKMKRLFLSVLLISALSSFAGKELAVNGNFQPNPRNKRSIPLYWHSQHTENKKEIDKVVFSISEPDGKGIHTLTVVTSEDYKKNDKSPWKNFCLFTTNTKALQTVKGDEFTVSAEIAGEGKLRYGFLGYGTKAVTKVVKVTKDFQKHSFTWTTRWVKGDASGKAFYRLYFEFFPGSRIQIKNVKIIKKDAVGKEAQRAGFRYYPVYRLAGNAADTIEKYLPNWKNIPEGKGFLINKLDIFQSIARQTSFKMAHKEGKLYVLICCEEPFMDQVQADKNSWRDGVMYKDDIMEFCISSARGINLVHSYNLANSRGASKRSHSFKTIPNTVLRKDNYWMIRMCFDLDDLLINGEKLLFNKDYYFNIGRTNHTNNNRNVHSSISREFGQTNTFQIMELLDKIPSAKEKETAEELFNGRYHSYLGRECQKISVLSAAKWKNTYEKFGRLNDKILAQCMRISKDAAKAKTFAEKENIVRSYQKMDEFLRTAQKNVTLCVSAPAGVKKFFLNGKSLPVSGNIPLTLEQGVNILYAETLPGAKVSFMVKNHPETLKAWRVSSKKVSAAAGKDFNDTNWAMAKCDDKGVFTSPGHARQIIVWENSHFGSWSLFTRTKKWNFVNNSLNTLKMQLDTPTAFPLKELSLTFELPSAYRIFEQDMSKKGTATSLRAVRITKEPSKRKGFTRYQYDYKGNIKPIGINPPAGSYLVFQADNRMKVGREFMFSYSRSSGNLVELVQNMPCKVLPPVNGRLLKNIYIETWLYGYNLSSNYFKDVDINLLHLKDRLAAGINMQWNEKYYSLYKDTPARQVILSCYPLWGSGWSIKKHFYNYVKEHKEAQARFFGGSVKWGGKADAGSPRYMDHRETTQVCPTWATTKGQKEYVRLVAEDMKEMRKKYPHAAIFYNNWEGFPSTKPMGYCFCDNCKEHFRKYASLSGDIILTDEVIRDRYWKKWYEFRVRMDGKVTGLVKKAANSLGMKYFLYHQYAHPDYWEAAAGNIDIPYQGCPGSAPADSRMQHIMDNVAKYMQKYGYKFFMGQIFNPGWDGDFRVRNHSVNSYTGFFEPETTKSQIIRSVATNRGGISVWGSNFSGSYYYIGEATRVLASYEDIFTEGTRKDSLVRSKDIAYPDALVVSRKNPAGKEERLVLLFNESEKVKSVAVENLSLPEAYSAEIFEGKKNIKDVKKITLTVPAKDVLILCIREK